MAVFDTDLWSEIWQSIMRQRWRSLMTAFGVFWGILMLTLLIGSGMGLNNGIAGRVKSLPSNCLFLIPQETSMAYQGLGRDRKWSMDNRDIDDLTTKLGQRLSYITSVNFADYQNVTRGRQTFQYQVAGVTSQFYGSLPQKLLEGRFINDIDVNEHRKVCVIGKHIADELYGEESPIGQNIDVNGTSLTVIGVIKNTNRQIDIGLDVTESVLMPLTTEQVTYGQGNRIDICMVILHDDSPVKNFEEQITGVIKRNHQIHPNDPTALMTVNLGEQIGMFINLFTGLNILIWIVGLGTLLAGLIGISNIMIVTVKERTQEIGVRRALGALPEVIIRQIMLESLTLTAIAGFAGLCLGIWLLSLLRDFMAEGGDNMTFTNPYVPFWTAIASLTILVIGGLFAGWMPARRALKIKAIDALREE